MLPELPCEWFSILGVGFSLGNRKVDRERSCDVFGFVRKG